MDLTHSRFGRFQLRTTDTLAARAFYADVVGAHVATWVTALPAQAAARGAPAHWLGHLRVADVEGAAAGLIAQGGERLGPMQRADDGSPLAVVRDPFGSVLALTSRPEPDAEGAVGWHELHTTDRAAAWACYAALTGWRTTDTLDLGLETGPYQQFAWADGDHPVGAMLDSARLPHIHTHWLFYFAIADLDAAAARVRAGGGMLVGEPRRHPSGARVVSGEDPQGAAFGLYQAG